MKRYRKYRGSRFFDHKPLSTRTVRKPVKNKPRKTIFEPLEPRLLLSADLQPFAGIMADAIGELQTDFDNLFTVLSTDLDTPLPLINQVEGTIEDAWKVAPSINDLLAMTVDYTYDGAISSGNEATINLLDGDHDGKVEITEYLQDFVDGIADELDSIAGGGTYDPSTFDDWLSANLDFSLSTGGLTSSDVGYEEVDIDVTATYSNTNQNAYDLHFDLTATKVLPIDLGRAADDYGLSFPQGITVEANVAFDLDFGVLTSGETASLNDDVFVDLSNLTAGVLAEYNLNGMKFNLGFLGLETYKDGTDDSNLKLDVEVGADAVDPTSPTALGFTAAQFDALFSSGTMTATNAPSAYDLTSDAEFILRVGDSDARTVKVTDALTNGNGDIAALIADVNTALNTAGLGDVVEADNNGGKIRLSVVSQNFNDLGFSSEVTWDGTAHTATNAPTLATPIQFVLAVDHGTPQLISIAGAGDITGIVTQLSAALSGTGVTASVVDTDPSPSSEVWRIRLDPGSHHMQVSNNLTFDSKISYSDLTSTSTADLLTYSVTKADAEIDLNTRITTGIDGLSASGLEINYTTSSAFGESLDTDPDNLYRIYLDPVTDISFTGFGDLLNFKDFSASTVIGQIQKLANWLGSVGSSDLFSVIDVPFSEGDLADVLDFTDMIADALLFDDGDDGIGGAVADVEKLLELDEGSLVPSFTNAQELAAKLPALSTVSLNAGIDGTPLHYDSVSKTLTYDLSIQHNLIDILLPIDFNFDLAPLLDVSSSSQVVLDATGKLNVTLGLDVSSATGGTLSGTTTLSSLDIDMSAVEMAPALTALYAPNIIYGRLTNDATFTMTIEGEKYRVTVDADNENDGDTALVNDDVITHTLDNQTVDDLIADITSGLQNAQKWNGSSFSGSYNIFNEAATSSLAIGKDTNNPERIKISATNDFTITAETGDPAINELGFKAIHDAEGSGLYTLTTTKDAPSKVGVLSENAVMTVTIDGTAYTVTVEAGETEANRTVIDFTKDVETAFATPSLLSGAVSTVDLTGDATFTVSVNDGPAVTVTVVDDDDNSDFADLVADINTALAVAGLDTQLKAEAYAWDNNDYVRLTASSAAVDKFSLTVVGTDYAATELQLPAGTTLCADLKDKIEVMSQGNFLVLRAADGSGITTFSVSGSGTGYGELGFDSSQSANNNDLRIYLTDNTVNGGLGYYDVSLDGATDIAGIISRINTQTSNDVVAEVNPDNNTGLRLTDTTFTSPGSSSDPVFRVTPINTSPAAVMLGILAVDPIGDDNGDGSINAADGDGKITGAPLTGVDLMDRFFVDNFDLSADFSLSAAEPFTGLVIDGSDDHILIHEDFGVDHVGQYIDITGGTNFTTGRYKIVSVDATTGAASLDKAVGTTGASGGTAEIKAQASANFGFVGVTLIGDGSISGKVQTSLKAPVPKTLNDLVDGLGDLASLVNNPTITTNSSSLTFDVELEPDISGLLLGATPQVVFNISSIGNPFSETEYSSPTWVSANSFSLSGDYTSIFKKGFVVDIELGSPVIPAEVLGSSYDAGTTTVTLVNDVLSGGTLAKVFAAIPAGISVDITDADLGDLLKLKDLDFSSVLASLQQLLALLQGMEGFELFDTEIPLINKSVNDFLGMANNLASALSDIANDPAASLQTLTDKIENAFGLPADGSGPYGINLDFAELASNILKFELDLGMSFNESIGVEIPELLNLSSLGIPGLDGAIGLSGSADLNATGSLVADFDFGIDLSALPSDPSAIDVKIYDTTGIAANLSIGGDNLSFSAGLGPLGLFIQNHDDFASELAISGAFSAGLKSTQSISQITFDSNDFDTSISGTIDGTLPTYFPTDSKYIGNITVDGDLADIADIQLITDTSTAALANHIVIDAGEVIDKIKTFDFANQFDLFDSILLAVDGLDMFFEGIQYVLDTEVFNRLDLPIVGDALTYGVNFIEDVREDFIDPLRALIDAVEDAADDFADADKNLISKFLNDTLGSLLQSTEYDSSDAPSVDEFQGYYGTDANKEIALTTNLDKYLNDEGTELKDTYIQWNLAIGDTYTFGTDFGFDIGLPGLGLEADGDVAITIGWDLDFGFGISFQDGFYVDISDGNELTAYIDVDLGDSSLTGTLGFLELSATVDPVTDLGVALEVDIIEKGASGDDAKKLQFTELGKVGFEAGIAASADIDLDLALEFSTDIVGSNASGFPKLGADFILDWGIGDYISADPETSTFVPFSGIGDAMKDGLHTVEFQNITLDLGSFVSDVLGPIVGSVKDYTEPIQPLIDFITTPFPVLSDFGLNITPLDLAAMYGQFDPGLIYAVADIITLINRIPDPDSVGSLMLNFGDMTLFDDTATGVDFSGIDLTDPNFDLSGSLDFIKANAADLLSDVFGDNWFSNTLGSLAGTAADIMGDLTEEAAETNPWAFPILEDPMQVFGLLMGKPAVLVTYDMAPLEFEFEYSQFFPIYGPLGVSINIEFGAEIDFAFGYDTLGIQEFVESDFRNPLLLFDGFYISDTDLPTGDFGTDVPELVLTGGLWAAAELNLGVARAGVGGGVFIEIDFDLFDPDRDGRVRLKEIAGNIVNEWEYGNPALAPLAIFDVHGEITAELFAFLKIDLFILKIDERFPITPAITILEFDIPFTRPPILATELEGGDLQINAGEFASQRLNGDLSDFGEHFEVKSLSDTQVQVRAPGLWEDWQTYDMEAGGTIIFKGGEGDDIFDGSAIAHNFLFDLDGMTGNDTIKLSASPGAPGAAIIRGSEGDDTLYGGAGDDIIYGLKGNDTIYGGGGNDIIFADDGRIGSDSITAFFNPVDDGDDKVYGGDGNDIIFGSGGLDTIYGDNDLTVSAGPDNDLIIGDGGKLDFANDTVPKTVANVIKVSNTQRDRLDPQGGNDILIGNDGNDIIYGGTGADTIDGGDGQDTIYGEEGFDTIYGGSDVDTIYGGDGGDTIYGERDAAVSAPYDTLDTGSIAGDTIYGEAGRDLIYGDENDDDGTATGDDHIYGGAGADIIDGDGGNDTIYGEGDPDWIHGGSGNDIIDGGAGNDVVFGDRGFEDVSGTSPVFDGSSIAYLDPDYDQFYLAYHGFLTGQAVKYSAGGGTAVEGLVDGHTYYVIVNDQHTIQLAATLLDAWSLTAINVTDFGTGSDHVFVPAWNETVYGVNTLKNQLYLFGVTTSADPGSGEGDPNNDADDDIRSGNGSDFIDGQWGDDVYRIRLMGADNDGIISVHDSGDSTTQSDVMRIKGTLYDDNFLLRKSSSSTGLAFVALLNEAPYTERINYWSADNGLGLERMLISGLLGDDHFASDDVGTDTTIEGNEGEDTFQIGQLYNSPRDICAYDYNHVEPEDVFATIETTVGWLSDGINRPMTIYGGVGNDYFTVFHNKAVLSLFGEDGDDTFLIKAFALAGSQEPFRDRTDVSGGAGVDLVQYAMNAPVNIDGGDGFDRVIIIGTEFGDDFVVTKDGVYGAGLNVNFVNIESLAVDGAEGDDRFYVRSTGEDFITELFGGLGSDTFNMSGDIPPVISNDLRGHSGVITHEIESTGNAYDETIIAGISANISDNNTPNPVVVISEPDGNTEITEGGGYDSYYIVLSKAPTGPVTVQVNAPIQTLDQQERRSMLFMLDSPTKVGTSDNGRVISLIFEPDNTNGLAWWVPQEVRVSAPDDLSTADDYDDLTNPLAPLDADDYDDDAIEGDQTGFINHVVTTSIGITGIPDSLTVTQDPVDSTKYTTTFVDAKPVDNDGNFTSFPNLQGYILQITDGPGAGQSLRILETIDGSTLLLDGQFRGCEGVEVGPASKYKITRDIEANRAITVLVHDNDMADVTVTPSNNSTDLFEGGATDTVDIVLTRAPTDSDVTVTLTSPDSQVSFSEATLVFDKDDGDPNDWNDVRTVTITAVDDTIREGFHHGLINFAVTGGDSDGLSLPTYTDTIKIGAIDGETQAYVGLLNRPAPDGSGSYIVTDVKVDSVSRAPETYEIVNNKIVFLTPGGDYEELAVGAVVKVTYRYETVGYDGRYVKPHLTDIGDDEVPQVKITETGDGTDVIEGPLMSWPWFDSYQVVLTQELTGTDTVQVLVDPQITKTSSGKVIHWGEQVEVISYHPDAIDNGDGSVSLVFNASNWDIPQAVLVVAVDDTNIDGDDTQVFAPEPHTVSDIQGPLYLYGEGGNGSIVDFEPLMLHYETDYMIETDAVDSVSSDGTTITVPKDTLIDAAEMLKDSIHDLIADSGTDEEILELIVAEMLTVTLADGTYIDAITGDTEFLHEIGQFRLIVDAMLNVNGPGEGDDTVTLTLNEAWDLSRSWENSTEQSYAQITEYTLTAMSPNFFADETEQIDYLFVYNEDSQADNEVPDREGWLTDATTIGYAGNSIVESFVINQDGKWLRGLGMASQDLYLGEVWHPRGITYGDMEVVEINLGDGIDEFTVTDTHVRSDGFQTWTIINTGDEPVVDFNGDGYIDGDTVTVNLDSDLAELHSGTVTAWTSDSLTDSNASFPLTTGERGLVGYRVEITGGTGLGQQRIIAINDETMLTFTEAWDVLPDGTSQYRVLGAEVMVGTVSSSDYENLLADLVPANPNLDEVKELDVLYGDFSSFSDAELVGRVIEIIDGAGVGTRREIIARTDTMITVSSTWNSDLDTTTVYRIYGDQDGPMSIDTQGGDDIVDASAASIPLVIFGGDGADTLTGGSADDIIFGDRGRVEYVNEAGKIVTLLGLARELLDPQYLDDFTLNTLTDVDGGYPVQTIDMQGLIGLMLSTPDGRGFGQRVQILSNTTDILTVTPDWNLEDENHWTVFDGAGDVNPGDNTITVGAHSFIDGDPVIYTNGGGTSIATSSGDLADMGTYYAIYDTATSIMLAASKADAIAGTFIDITAAGSGAEHLLIAPLKVVPGVYDPITDFDAINPQNNPTKYRISLVPEDQTDGVTRDPSLLIAVASAEAGDDTIVGNGGDDRIFGGDGDDTVNGHTGDDMIFGDLGRLDYTPANVGGEEGPALGDFVPASLNRARTTYDDVGGADTVYGDDGNDIIFGGYNAEGTTDALYGNADDEVIFGDNGVMLFVPNEDTPNDPRDVYLDSLETLAIDTGGADIVSGGGDDDILIGGTAADTVYGDDSSASAGENDGEDIILGDNASIDFEPGVPGRLDAYGSGLRWIQTTDTSEATGGDDTLSGNAAIDVVLGGVGADTIHGDAITEGSADLADVILGDNGYVSFVEDALEDPMTLELIRTEDTDLGGADTISGNAGDDIIFGGTAGDTVHGDANDDLILGDFGRMVLVDAGSKTSTEETYDKVFFGSIARLVEITDHTEGGVDTIYGDQDEDILIGGANADNIDGDLGDDLIFGDNVSLDRWTGYEDDTSPRFRTLNGDAIYGESGADDGESMQNATHRLIPDLTGTPVWQDWDIDILDHTATVPTNSFGNDYIAGGGDDDTIFAQRGDDIVQGDGSIDGKILQDDGLPAVGAYRDGDNLLVVDASFEAATDGDDYIEGNGGDDVIFGNLGQDDIIGDNSDIFSLDTLAERELDGSDLIFGGAGTDIARNDIGDATADADGLITVDPTGHARDADMILGDNGNIYRLVENVEEEIVSPDPLVDATRYLEFNYDQDTDYEDRGDLRIIVRAADLLDYTPGGPDYGAAFVNGTADYGQVDELHGESGDDFIYGMTGSDVLFGEGQDDDLIGGYGHDWISGGTGQDGVIGDDGRIYTSRNNGHSDLNGEALNNIEPLLTHDPSTKESNGNVLDEEIATPGKIQTAKINVSGELNKAVNLTPFSYDATWFGSDDEYPDSSGAQYADDIIFGGLGSDFLHGGSGDDAISGAEALEHAYVPVYVAGEAVDVLDLGYLVAGLGNTNPGDVLAYNTADADGQHLNNRFRAGEFALYDEYDPLRQILLTAAGDLSKDGTGVHFLLNFDETEGVFRPGGEFEKVTGSMEPGYDAVHDDGGDVIFGDLGNDWLVGGTGTDTIYGGWGNDLLNADDDLTTNTALNDQPDSHPTYEDRAFGGAGRDVLIANTGGDRLIDWVGEYNSYLVPYAPFGSATVSRTMQPQLKEFLYALSASDGADATRAADTGADPARNGEPEGELGLVVQKDFAWQDQTGAPSDPQAGNIPGGKRDVLRTSSFNDGDVNSNAMFVDSGVFSVESGQLVVTAESLGGDAISVYNVDKMLPSYFEIQASITMEKPTGGWKANAYIIFDYQGPDDFKFAGIDASRDKIQLGHRTAEGWIIDAETPAKIKPGTYYNILVAVNGTNVTVVVDGQEYFTHTFAPRVDEDGWVYGINDGMIGLGSDNSRGTFDNIVVQVLPPDYTLDVTEDFADTVVEFLTVPQSGTWTMLTGSYEGTSDLSGYGISLVDLGLVAGLQANSVLDMELTVNTGGTTGIVFDYYDIADFKYVGLSADSDALIIGHYINGKWMIDASTFFAIKAGTDYELSLALKGTTVDAAIRVDGASNWQAMVGHVFNAVTVDGQFGLLAKDGTASFDSVTIRTDDPAFRDVALKAAAAAETTAADLELLNNDALAPIVQEAIARWRDSGLVDDIALAMMARADYQVADLDGLLLGDTGEGLMTIDADAAGYGWFVDTTPQDDSEFVATTDGLTAAADSAAYGRMDLLSAVMHELGHIAGYQHSDSGVMDADLDAGERVALVFDDASGKLSDGSAVDNWQHDAMLRLDPAKWHKVGAAWDPEADDEWLMDI